MLKKILYGVLALIALVVIISLFLPGSAHVERSTEISAPVSKVFPVVNDMKAWDKWSPWDQKDPDMAKTWGEITEGQGANYSWEGDPDQVGTGTMTFNEVMENEKIMYELDFAEQGTALGGFEFSESDGITSVKWYFDTDVSSPFVIGKFFGMMMDGFVGPDFENGLANLKEYVESMPPYSIEIVETEFGDMHYLYIRGQCSTAELQPNMAERAGVLTAYAAENGLEMAGMPFSLYYDWGDSVDFAFCIPIGSEAAVDHDRVEYAYMETGKFIKGTHKGPYDNLGDSYNEMQKYMEDNAVKPMGAAVEYYENDPGAVADESELLTSIYFPIGS